MADINSLKVYDSLNKIIQTVDLINSDIDKLEEEEKSKIINSLDYEVFTTFRDVDLPETYKFISENKGLFQNNLYAQNINQRLQKLAETLFRYKDIPKNYSTLNSVVNHLAEIRRLLNDLNSSKMALDNTNIILDNPDNIIKLYDNENIILIPEVVIDELDNKKSKDFKRNNNCKVSTSEWRFWKINS